jgi:hypothetical protein
MAGFAKAMMPKQIRRIVVETKEPKMMRYRTVGDWFFCGDDPREPSTDYETNRMEVPGVLVIQVADTGDWRYNMLVAIHEFCEVVQCVEKGITQKQVDKFDYAHQDDEDPGSHPKAPYHDQHMTAMGIEMLLSVALGIKWRPYEEVLDRTSMKVPLRKKK